MDSLNKVEQPVTLFYLGDRQLSLRGSRPQYDPYFLQYFNTVVYLALSTPHSLFTAYFTLKKVY
jgi:hypothetical protein